MMTESERAAFRQRMAEHDQAHGVEHAAAAPLQPAGDFYALEQRCQRAWDSDPAIRAEFLELERYIAFVKADSKGWVKIFGRSRNT